MQMNNKAKGCKIVISQCHAKKHFKVGFFIYVLVYAYLEEKKSISHLRLRHNIPLGNFMLTLSQTVCALWSYPLMVRA
jgi:hypothetical protein